MKIGSCSVCAEKDRRIEDLKAIIEQLTRITRAREGLPEIAPQPRKPVEPMPKEVRELIDAWDSQPIREDLERRAYRLVGRGKKWDEVKTVLQQSTDEDA